MGEDLSLEELDRKFDAIFLGIGLGESHALPLTGEGAPKVIDALHYIEAYKSRDPLAVGRIRW